MPVPYLDKLAKETGKSVNELEKLWGKAKKIASEHFGKPESEFGDKEFAYTVGVVKKMLGKEENTESLVVTEDVKIPGTRFIIKKGQTFEFSAENEAVSSLENVQAQVVKLFKNINGLYVKDTRLKLKKHTWEPDSNLSIEVEWDYGVDLKKLEPQINAICKRFPEVHWDYYDFPDFPIRWYYFYESSTQESIEITKECLIPGTNIVLEEGDKIQLVESIEEINKMYILKENDNERIKEKEDFEKVRYIIKCKGLNRKSDTFRFEYIDDYWDSMHSFFVFKDGTLEDAPFTSDPGCRPIYDYLVSGNGLNTLINNPGVAFGLYPDKYPFGKKFILKKYPYIVSTRYRF